ncbi:MAG: hypothetical protein DRQ51_04225 [Gammaproteobacteria bacterium]|nr:MAG: hypothetical protein DRQ51_04225 [Gammaproteobacteria bacterium]
MINNTDKFITLIKIVLNSNIDYFNKLEAIKSNNLQKVKNKILDDYDIKYEQQNYNLDNIFQENIKLFIEKSKKDFTMDMSVLDNILKQIEIDYYFKKYDKDTAKLYYSIVQALRYYGIYKEQQIMSLSNHTFWEKLIKKIYLLNLMNTNLYSTCCDENYYKFNKTIPNLVESKENIENTLNENIDIIDGKVIFRKNQEERIVQKIEKKLSSYNLFYFLEYVFEYKSINQKNHRFEINFPYKYIINLLIKNISMAKHKITDEIKIKKMLDLICSFISLYELTAENQYENMNMTEYTIMKILKKQILYSNFYSIHKLKTNTLLEYLDNIISPSIDNSLFFKKFSFSIKDLSTFVKLLDRQPTSVIVFEENNIHNNELNILKLFSVDAKNINTNYTTAANLDKIENIFVMNPIIKYKNKFYIIGFQYFKLNFYNSLIEKIKSILDKKINEKIGSNIDVFVEDIFKTIKDKHNYELFSGNYRPPKKENPESDLVIKLDNDIIFIENKNKYLTNKSFSGYNSNILKDLVLSFGFSQKQLLKHERNLIKYKLLTFDKDKSKVAYNKENIIKISVSTNNWYSIMNNIPSNLLLSLIQIRFEINPNITYDDIDSFKKANKYLDDLQSIIGELSNSKDFNMKIILNQMLFLPLELIVEKYMDDNFIDILKKLVRTKMNTDNVINIYDYIVFLDNYKEKNK